MGSVPHKSSRGAAGRSQRPQYVVPLPQVIPEGAQHRLAHLSRMDIDLDECPDGDTVLLADQREQKVLRLDVVVAQLQCLAQREIADDTGTPAEARTYRAG